MKLKIPPVKLRREVRDNLRAFFDTEEEGYFVKAFANLSHYYNVGVPRTLWFEYIDNGKTGGVAYSNGRIDLVHPANWKKARKYKSPKLWIDTVLHEYGHYLLWSDPEKKADDFARQMLAGLKK